MDRLDVLFAEPTIARLHDEFHAYAEGSLTFYRAVERSALSEETRAFASAVGGSIGLDALQGLDRLTRLMIQTVFQRQLQVPSWGTTPSKSLQDSRCV